MNTEFENDAIAQNASENIFAATVSAKMAWIAPTVTRLTMKQIEVGAFFQSDGVNFS